MPRILRMGSENCERIRFKRRSTERIHAWFNRFRSLPLRDERRRDISETITSLAASPITLLQIARFR